MHLLVVLRTCDHTEVHPERGQRFIDCPKSVLIRKCFTSLVESIKRAHGLATIELRVIDDSSSIETLHFMKSKAESLGVQCTIETCRERGFNWSAHRQFEVCRDEGRELVYSVEDDYLHFPNAIEQMLLAYDKFKQVTGSIVAMRPDDDLFMYAPNNHHSRKPSIVLLGEDRHWRTIHSTHNTILTHVDVFRQYWHLFASLAIYFKRLRVNEDKTINLVWDAVPLFAPMPGLAMHVSQNNPPPFTDYSALWESIET